MKKLTFALSLLFLALTTALPSFATDKVKESTYDRIMRTGELRCGYWNWAPLFTVDSNTNEYGGIFHDFMTEFERVSGIKVKWPHEISYSNTISDLETGKVDAICAGVWPSSMRAKRIIFSQPLFYIPVEAYAKADDSRFDNNLKAINSPDVMVAVMDGLRAEEIKRTDFPEAKVVSVPQIAGTASELLVLVQTGKADVTFTDAINGSIFIEENNGEVKAIQSDIPLRLMPNTIGLNDDDARLKMFFDDVINELQFSGTLEKILKKARLFLKKVTN